MNQDPRDELASIPPAPLHRAALGGLLMGLANLVPGISGGTMLLATGVYARFIDAVANVTRLRLERRSLVFLLVVVASAGLGIVLLAGTVKSLVVEHRWAMYSLFVGLTLGGVPTLWRMARPASRALWWGAGAGFLVMGALGYAQQTGAAGGSGAGGVFPLFVAGAAGAAAMVLPGVSGGYLLLVLGQYVRILSAIEAAADGVAAGDLAATLGPVLGVFVPVGIGVVVGIAGISNLLRHLLLRHRAATLGVLLGLLTGVVVGLWPFQHGVAPEPGMVVKGTVVTETNRHHFDPEDWPVRIFPPTATQAALAVLLVAAGGAVTMLIGRGDD